MKTKMPKAIRRTDWRNYLDPEDQARAKEEQRYRISSRMDAMVDYKGDVSLVLHNGPDYVGDTILGKAAMAKLAYVLKNAGRTR
ncbi:MAG: hypothetical protein HY077_16955 [Elusimicrobia bacterium]|nr:hypothetical protein [Elusimicrobiota bacterium]